MARLLHPRRALSTNPLKSSAPLGTALAYLGIERSVPLLHGAQGCTAFGMVHLVRHFREAVPLQTTAMNEITTILGGAEQIEAAIETLRNRAKPAFIGIASTALTETRGEDIAGILREIMTRRSDFADTAVVHAATPDFAGAMPDGWARAVEATLTALVPEGPRPRAPRQVTLLCPSHLTPAEIEELVRLIAAFGLEALVLPDLSASLDGHMAEDWSGCSLGGTPVARIAEVARSACTLAVGETMRGAAEIIAARTGVPFRLFPALTGLAAVDGFVRALMELSGRDAPASVRRDRARLVDAAVDAQFFTGGLRVALAADPDLLYALATALAAMGAEIVAAVTTTDSPLIARMPCDTVTLGDLGDLQRLAGEAGAELLITHSHGRHAARALGLPLLRVGFPIFDRLGAQDACRVGYRGTRAFLFEVANAMQAVHHSPRPEDFGAAPPPEEFTHVPQPAPC